MTFWSNPKLYLDIFNFLLISVLFFFSFTGSLVSIATVEMEEANEAFVAEEQMIKLDSSRVAPVRIHIERAGRPIEIEFANRVLADQYHRQNKIQLFIGLIPGNDHFNYLKLPDKVILTIAATFMGLLGAVIMLIKESTYDGIKLSPETILKRAALGFSSGLLVIVLSYVIPGVITFDSQVEIKIETLTTISLLAGMFFKVYFNKISNQISK